MTAHIFRSQRPKQDPESSRPWPEPPRDVLNPRKSRCFVPSCNRLCNSTLDDGSYLQISTPEARSRIIAPLAGAAAGCIEPAKISLLCSVMQSAVQFDAR